MTSYSLAEWIVERAGMVRSITEARRALDAAEHADASDAILDRLTRDADLAENHYDRSRARAELNFGREAVTQAVNAVEKAAQKPVRYVSDTATFGTTDEPR